MALARMNEFTLEVKPEPTGSGGDGFNTEDAAFATNAKTIRVGNVSASVDYEAIEDSRYTSDLGEHQRIKGLAHPSSSFSFDTWAEGLGTATTDGVAATNNAISWLGAAVFGAAPVLSTGDQVAAAPTDAANFSEDLNGEHGVGQLVAVGLSTGIEVRPITAYSAAAITLGMNLSATPAENDDLYGGANLQWTDNPATFHTVQCRLVDRASDDLNKKLRGMAGSLSLSEQPPNQPQMLSWSFNLGSFADDYSDTQSEPTPTRPTVLAGGQFLIAKEGTERAYTEISYGSIGVNFNASYNAVPDPNDSTGIQAWHRDKGGRWEVTVHLPHDHNPNTTLSTTNDTWREIWRDGTVDENAFQMLLQYGSTAGSIFALWFRSLILVGWEEVELDGIASQKLTFARKTGTYYSQSAANDSNWNETNVPPCIMALF